MNKRYIQNLIIMFHDHEKITVLLNDAFTTGRTSFIQWMFSNKDKNDIKNSVGAYCKSLIFVI